jgi:hypothetical protein
MVLLSSLEQAAGVAADFGDGLMLPGPAALD